MGENIKTSGIIYSMSRTMQLGDCHWKKGEQFFVRPIKGTDTVLISKRKHQPAGHTVARDFLRTFATVEHGEPQEVFAAAVASGKPQHTFRHVGSVILDEQGRTKVYTMDGQPEARYYVKGPDGFMRGIGSTANWCCTFKAREEQ